MITLSKVSKGFGGQAILRDLNFEVLDGEKLCVIGQSGCGKSVTLKLMTGLLSADEGTIVIDGVDVTAFRPQQWGKVLSNFGVVFQSAALFSSLTVFENVG